MLFRYGTGTAITLLSRTGAGVSTECHEQPLWCPENRGIPARELLPPRVRETAMSAADRRQTPRVDVQNQLRIEIAPLSLEVSVLDFSFGGFRAECAAP